jgi:hypothetical protein
LTSLFNNTFHNTFENTAIPSAAPVETAAAPKKRGWLPLLTVLFLISYALMTMLIIEQGQTIESQRVLIRELFRDSTELSALKQAQMAKSVAEGQSRTQAPTAKIPIQTPSTQAPVKQTPSAQAVPQHQVQKQSQKPQFQMPSRPASDVADENRSLITI